MLNSRKKQPCKREDTLAQYPINTKSAQHGWHFAHGSSSLCIIWSITFTIFNTNSLFSPKMYKALREEMKLRGQGADHIPHATLHHTEAMHRRTTDHAKGHDDTPNGQNPSTPHNYYDNSTPQLTGRSKPSFNTL